MLLSVALILILGFVLGALFDKLRLPRLIGMLIMGILLGPHALNLIDPGTLGISADLRKLALIIILIRAGLSLDMGALKKVGRPALLMSFVPAIFEIGAFTLLAPPLMGVTMLEGAILGAVMGAVSPAIVVPRMVMLTEQGYGVEKGVPQLITAGASLDDVFVIVIFTALVSLAQGGAVSAGDFLGIPVSIVLGIALGAVVGMALAWVFSRAHMRDSAKVVLVLGVACLLAALEDIISVPVSGLLAVMAMAAALHIRRMCVAERLSVKFSKIWIAAEIALFVLVGAQVDIGRMAEAGMGAVATILLALGIRTLGVGVCMLSTALDFKERLFCMISYLPKATVQAAIGSVPLALGLPCGEIVLSTAVLAIVITAPLGAIAMDLSYKKLLTSSHKANNNAK